MKTFIIQRKNLEMDDAKLEIINKILGETIPHRGRLYNYHFHFYREEYEKWKTYLISSKAFKINTECYHMRGEVNYYACLAIDFLHVDLIGYKFTTNEIVSIFSGIFEIEDARFYLNVVLNIEVKTHKRLFIVDAVNMNTQDIIDYENLDIAKREGRELVVFNGLLTKAVK